MKTLELYVNYGVLAAEKRTVYTHGNPSSTATCSDKIEVVIPEGWDLANNCYGDTLLVSPWGDTYDPNQLLMDANDKPYLFGIDKGGYKFNVRLFTTEEFAEQNNN